MKRIIAMILTAVLLIGTLAGCERFVGTSAKDPETEAKLTQSALTIKATSTDKNSGSTTSHTFSYQKNGEKQIYYFLNKSGDFYNEIYGIVEGDKEIYYTRPSATQEFTELQNPVTNFDSSKAYFEYCAAFYGFNATKLLKVTEYKKQESGKAMNKECYVYAIKFTDIDQKATADIYVDKETGIWLKTVIKKGDETQTTEINSIQENANGMPGLAPVEMKEQVIYDKNNIVMTAKSLTYDNPNFAGVLEIETQNNSDSNIKFYSHSFSVNGLYVGDRVFSGACTKGETTTTKIELKLPAMEVNDITEFATFTFPVCIRKTQQVPDGNTFTETDGDYIEERSQALKITTELGDDYQQTVNTEGEALLDEKDIKLIFQDCQKDSTGNTKFVVYCENNFDQDVRITVDFVEINGKEFSFYDKIYMSADCKGKSGFYLSSSDLASVGVSEITSMKFTLGAYYGPLFNSTTLIPKTDPITIAI